MRKQPKPSFHGGRWQVERERGHIKDSAPAHPFKDAESVQELLARLLKRLGADIEPWLSVLEQEWPQLVGDDVAAHTRPGRMQHGKLIVFVDHSIWMQELNRNAKRMMLKRLQQRFGHTRIRDILLRIDPGVGA